jgi:hypothetical protein
MALSAADVTLGALYIIVVVVTVRVLWRLQTRLDDLAERVAHLEGERNGRGMWD